MHNPNQYISETNILKLLMNCNVHALIYQYAATALTIAPENTKAYYWLILSYRKQNMDDLTAGELGAAKQKFSEEESQKLLRAPKNENDDNTSYHFHATAIPLLYHLKFSKKAPYHFHTTSIPPPCNPLCVMIARQV